MTMKRILLNAGLSGASTLILCLCLTSTGMPALAQNNLILNVKLQEESDGADRIQVAGQLPALTEQVAAASCALTSGVVTKDAQKAFKNAAKAFETYIFALRYGDVGLDIVGPEERRLTLAALNRVEGEWQVLQAAVNADLTGLSTTERAGIVDALALRTMDVTNAFAAGIAGQYAHPHEISASDLMMMMIAGRLRTLTQTMAKQACKVWSTDQSEAARGDLRQSMDVFEASLTALRFGLPEVGVQEAPNDDIRDALDQVLARWEIMKLNQQRLVDGEALTKAEKTDVLESLRNEFADLGSLVQAYKMHTERSHAVRTRTKFTPAKPSPRLRLRLVP